jgi:hypothetical protein
MNERKLAAITPLVLLLIIVVFAQLFVVPRWVAVQETAPTSWGPNVSGLQLLGYNYNRDLVEISVAFWNRGSQSLTIAGVSYDGVPLTMGKVGSPNDLMFAGNSLNVDPVKMNSTITPNEIIFPASDHWNMYTYGPTVPKMEANGMATLYLGVTSVTPGTTHTLVIEAGGQQYVFQLIR